ncbi:hypothetical protein B0H66DRAFT_571348 [Apodospora peruviana]|uniref:Fucose-specific lectin n=1 Tax=Apodospora peruviana TaxID=516989 RepID=A0AAE0LXT5_9PEZI|nr:hypothetical protein B0H66DRAFT_571348 [Apodospora peruviana]
MTTPSYQQDQLTALARGHAQDQQHDQQHPSPASPYSSTNEQDVLVYNPYQQHTSPVSHFHPNQHYASPVSHSSPGLQDHSGVLPYSNLEVVQNHNAKPADLGQGYGIEVYNYHHKDKQHPVLYAENDPTSPPLALPSPGDEKIFHPESQSPEVVSFAHQTHLPPIPGSPSPTLCGIRRKPFWIIMSVVAFIVLAAAIGGGVGGYFASRNSRDSRSEQPAVAPNATVVPPRIVSNMSLAALRWEDPLKGSQYRVYFQPTHLNDTQILESAWSADTETWVVQPITDPNTPIKPGTPITASTGFPHTNTSNPRVRSVYYATRGTVIERQTPYKENADIWGNDNGSGQYAPSNASSLFSFWYQDFHSKLMILALFFSGENITNGHPWQSTRLSLSIQDGSPLAAAPATVGGDQPEVKLYAADKGSLTQLPFNLETNILGNPMNAEFPLAPNSPLCVSIENNTNYYTAATLPQCATTWSITHLVLFAAEDRRGLTLVSWNCSSGFVDATARIAGLMKQGRTYLGVASTSPSNMTNFVDQRVYVLFEEPGTTNDTTPKMEEWVVPDSGKVGDTKGQNGNWRVNGEVPIKVL